MKRNTIKDFYAGEVEGNRLEQEAFILEGIRTKEIIERYIHQPGREILDVGGGAGHYSFWLQQKGHHVTLVDLSPANIELATKYGETSGMSLNKIEIGDAVDLAGNSGAVLSDAGARVFCSLTTSSAGRSAHGTPE